MTIKFELCSTNIEYYPFKYHVMCDDGFETYIKDGELNQFLDECDADESMTIAYLVHKEGSHKINSPVRVTAG